jgi:hypothetical protein
MIAKRSNFLGNHYIKTARYPIMSVRCPILHGNLKHVQHDAQLSLSMLSATHTPIVVHDRVTPPPEIVMSPHISELCAILSIQHRPLLLQTTPPTQQPWNQARHIPKLPPTENLTCTATPRIGCIAWPTIMHTAHSNSSRVCRHVPSCLRALSQTPVHTLHLHMLQCRHQSGMGKQLILRRGLRSSTLELLQSKLLHHLLDFWG